MYLLTNCIRHKNINFLRNSVAIRSLATKTASKSTLSDEDGPIVLPKKINRKPTDLLRALSRTVERDPTAPHYKYHDDPYLAPKSNYSKDLYALSQESGKRTAQWLKQDMAKLFEVII